jgi:hypothetical protein
MKSILSIAIIFICITDAAAQHKGVWDISINGNQYIPQKSAFKTVFPLIHTSSKPISTFAIGGFGIQAAYTTPFKQQLHLQHSLGVQKWNYWMKHTARDPVAIPMGEWNYSLADITTTLSTKVQKTWKDKLQVGAGLGINIPIVQLFGVNYFDASSQKISKTDLIPNQLYNPTFVLPVAANYKIRNIKMGVRYEQGIINRNKAAIVRKLGENFGVVYYEFGYTLGRKH